MATGLNREGTLELTAQRLLEARKALGDAHAAKVFAALIADYKLNDWEARAVRSRFQELCAV